MHTPMRKELILRTLLLGLFNGALLTGCIPLESVLLSSAPAGGLPLWARWLVHPFAHGSWYHALLDIGAFLALYPLLDSWKSFHRIALMAWITACSGCAAWQTAAFHAVGLCGLSAIGHGLLAAWAVGLLVAPNRHDPLRLPALAALLLVLAKSLWEAASLSAWFSPWHFGQVGTPIVITHLAGTCAGIIAAALHSRTRNTRTIQKKNLPGFDISLDHARPAV